MKRQLISLMIILPLSSLFSSLEIYAQKGTGDLDKKSTTTPVVKDPRSASSAPATPTLPFGVEKKGKLDPKNSDKNADGSFYEEMILNDAKSEDLLTFHIESDNPSLDLQIFDKNKAEVAVSKDPSGNFKISTPTGGLPADGDYRVRVTCAASAGRNAVLFRLKVNRFLTAVAYTKRLYIIDNDSKIPVEKTVVELEELVKLAPDDRYRSVTYGRLSDIHLKRMDVVKAEVAMDRMIKANGVVRLNISFDSKWRPMAKLRTGNFGFEDKRLGSLGIGAGQLTIYDTRDRTLASLTGRQIGELSKNLVAAYNLISITAINNRRPYVFAPETMRQAEADLIIKLIQKHVMGKAN